MREAAQPQTARTPQADRPARPHPSPHGERKAFPGNQARLRRLALETSPAAAELQADALAPVFAKPEHAPPGRLPRGMSHRLSQHFGMDFSQLQVHSDAAAADRTAQYQALAMAEGSNLYFGPNRWQPHTPRGALLAAHEAIHAAQQGLGLSTVAQGEPRYFSKGSPHPEDIYEEVKKRAPDVAVFLDLKTVQRALGTNKAIEGPKVDGGTDGTDVHEWHVELNMPTYTGIAETRPTPRVTRSKAKGKTIVKHVITVFVGVLRVGATKEVMDIADAAEAAKTLPGKARNAADYTYDLLLIEPLIHELLHVRILMETDPSFRPPAGGPAHSSLVQGYLEIIAASHNPAVAKERQAVRGQLGLLAGLHGATGAEFTSFTETNDEFLVHEKYDGQLVFGLMGYTGGTNTFVAQRYAEEVNSRARTFGPMEVTDSMKTAQVQRLAAFATAYYDAIDRQLASAAPASSSSTPPPATTAPPATKSGPDLKH